MISPPLRAQDWLPLLRAALEGKTGSASDKRFRWPLRGGSMWPTLPPDCEIEIAPLPRRAALGALIVYADGDALVAHRLVRRDHDRWITHGDGRLAPDAAWNPAQALGIVAAAYVNQRRCWPRPFDRFVIPFWLARHHALRVLRGAWRLARRLAPRLRLLRTQHSQ